MEMDDVECTPSYSKERPKLSFKVLSYNVDGLKSKKLYDHFFTFIKDYEIFFLLETFVIEEEHLEFHNYFGEYKLHWIHAERTSSMGRASGGMLFGVKNEIYSKYNCSFVERDDSPMLGLQINSNKWIIIPTYLNCSHWHEEFKKLENDVKKNHENGGLMLIGDFNARVGNKQIVPNQQVAKSTRIIRRRVSKDQKKNAEGYKLVGLCTSYNLYMLNGRSASDSKGEYTFIGGNGISVIDYCLITERLHDFVSDFRVEPVPFSNHMPIVVTIEFDDKSELTRPLELVPEEYREKLDQLLPNYVNSSSNDTDCLIKLIQDMAKEFQLSRRQPWYDYECETASKNVMDKLMDFRNDSSLKKNYTEAQQEFKQICENKNQKYYKVIIQELIKLKDAKSYWNTISKLKGNTHVIGNSLEPDSLYNHFKKPLGSAISEYEASPVEEDIQMEELKIVLETGKANKPPGKDRVPYEFFQNGSEIFFQTLLSMFNKIYNDELIPQSFRDTILFPLLKKGEDPNISHNYKAKPFINVVAKIFTGILLNRLKKWVEDNNKRGIFQTGFNNRFGKEQHIFTLMSLAKIKIDNKMKLYACFIDLKDAFSTLNRNVLFQKLKEIGISTKFLRILKSLYGNNRSAVWNGLQLSEWFEVNIGLKPGCLLSPILCSLFLSDLNEEKLFLAHVDNIVILAEDHESLQLSINKMKDYCSKNELSINTIRPKILVFENTEVYIANEEKWEWNSDEVEVVKSFEYLGLTFSWNLSLKTHFKIQIAKTKSAIDNTFKTVLNHSDILHTEKFETLQTVAKLFACCDAVNVWGCTWYDELEEVQINFLKRLYYLPSCSNMIYLETGHLPLFLYTLRCHIEFIRSILTSQEKTVAIKLMMSLECQKLQSFKELDKLYQDFQLDQLDFFEPSDNIWNKKLETFIDGVKTSKYMEFTKKSKAMGIHKNYTPPVENNYFKDPTLTAKQISYIFKARRNKLILDYSKICTLCNLEVNEDIMYHFIGECPILNEIRRKYFERNDQLSREQVHEYLNGKNWSDIANYCQEAFNYRQKKVNKKKTKIKQ